MCVICYVLCTWISKDIQHKRYKFMYDNQSTTSPLKSRFRCYTESPTVQDAFRPTPASSTVLGVSRRWGHCTGSVQEMGTLYWECPGDGDTVLGMSRRWGHCPMSGSVQEMGTLSHVWECPGDGDTVPCKKVIPCACTCASVHNMH